MYKHEDSMFYKRNLKIKQNIWKSYTFALAVGLAFVSVNTYL